jgi:hypothetical protein
MQRYHISILVPVEALGGLKNLRLELEIRLSPVGVPRVKMTFVPHERNLLTDYVRVSRN